MTVLFAWVSLLLSSVAAVPPGRVEDVTFQQARPILQALADRLPEAFRGKSADEQNAAWPSWLAAFKDKVRERIIGGDEDTLVNFLLFGTSYTHQPRLTAERFREAAKSVPNGRTPAELPAEIKDIILNRVDDLVRGLADPRGNERLLFFKSLVSQKGFRPEDAGEAPRLKAYVLSNLSRVMGEASAYSAHLAAAGKLHDPGEEFVERSTLFQDRGLSLDAALKPNFAIEQSLRTMKERGLLRAGSIRRVAVIGPGLDFTDKDEGYDFYPPQTLQPFALLDSLARLGLVDPGGADLTVFDVNAQVIDHLTRANRSAVRGIAYTLQLPRELRIPWNPEYVNYWERFGDRIGNSVPPAALPPGADLDDVVRAVRIRPEIVARIRPVPLNIVAQRLSLPAAQRFDLVIATNILVYYDVFEQSLALINISSMLGPGGFLLSNNALLELPSFRIHSVDYQTVTYSDRPGDGEHVVWYQRLPD